MSQPVNDPGDRGQIFDGVKIGRPATGAWWMPATGHDPICPRISRSWAISTASARGPWLY